MLKIEKKKSESESEMINTVGSLAERIREAAKNIGGGSELSRLTDIPRGTLQRYLKNESEPQVSTLIKIANAASVTVQWLITGEGTPPLEKGAEPPFEKLGNRIELCSDKLGTETLSEKTGISHERLERYQRGLVDVTASDLQSIAVAANVSLAWLAGGEGAMHKREEANNDTITFDVVLECSRALHEWLEQDGSELDTENIAHMTALLCSMHSKMGEIDSVLIDRLLGLKHKP